MRKQDDYHNKSRLHASDNMTKDAFVAIFILCYFIPPLLETEG